MIALSQESPKKGVVSIKMRLQGSAALLQFAATHLLGILEKRFC